MQKNNTKRKTLKLLSIAGGISASGLSSLDNWVKPVIESVVLPAHAATSEVNGSFNDTGVLFTNNYNTPSILDNLIPSAHAWSFSEADVCIDIVNNVADIFVIFGSGPDVYGKLSVPVPFDYIEIETGDMKYFINGQFQEVDGQTIVAGNIRELDNYYPYIAKPQAGSCELTITPPPP